MSALLIDCEAARPQDGLESYPIRSGNKNLNRSRRQSKALHRIRSKNHTTWAQTWVAERGRVELTEKPSLQHVPRARHPNSVAFRILHRRHGRFKWFVYQRIRYVWKHRILHASLNPIHWIRPRIWTNSRVRCRGLGNVNSRNYQYLCFEVIGEVDRGVPIAKRSRILFRSLWLCQHLLNPFAITPRTTTDDITHVELDFLVFSIAWAWPKSQQPLMLGRRCTMLCKTWSGALHQDEARTSWCTIG